MMDQVLEFEKEALLNVLSENSLTISSKGIVNDRLLLNLVKTFSNACHLVLVIGTNLEEENSIISELDDFKANNSTVDDNDDELLLPKRISAESMLANNRRDLYLSGGVIFITTRILVVDMLTKRVPFESISGIIVSNAHRVTKDCHLSFILRLFRMNNKTGFITALSQNANAFFGSFGQLERIMRQLFVTKLFLWPRFHATISESIISRVPPKVTEMRIYMTPSMKQIQFAIVDLISMCIKELTSMNSFIYSSSMDTSLESAGDNSISTINVIANNFNKIIRANLDSVWYQLSLRARRLIHDIQLLKALLFHLTELDAVSFYGELKHIRDNVTPDSNPSDWLFWTPTETLFKLAKERVFFSSKSQTEQQYNIEINPKLDALSRLLEEIEEDQLAAKREKRNKRFEKDDYKDNNASFENENESSFTEQVVDIVIVLENRYSIIQIEQFRDKGIDVVLEELKHKCQMFSEGKKIKLTRKSNNNEKTVSDNNNEMEFQEEEQLTLTQMLGQMEDHNSSIIRKHHQLQLHYYEWSADNSCGLGLKKLLTTLHPRYVIIYEPEMSCIRQIELYQALYASPQRPPVQVYFFIYDGSSEEQRYLRNLQVEKEAFEKLIESKSKLAKSKDNDGTSGDHPDLVRGSQSLLHPDEISSSGFNSRAGGSGRQSLKNNVDLIRTVLVDMREFRSLLPSCIHKTGIELEPVTLEIGDYVITPDTCIERKSIADLIGSLNSGRLYSQAQTMTRYYKRSLLLIEFEDSKSFNFKARYWGAAQNFSKATFNGKPSPLVQLAVLTIQFPLLRIIWSPTPSFSAEIIDKLKHGKDEPCRERDVIHLSTSSGEKEANELPIEYVTDRFDIEVKEFLLCLPGVTTQNVYWIMNRVPSIVALVELSVEELTELLSSSHNAELLYQTLHTPVMVDNNETNPQLGKNSALSTDKQQGDKTKKRFTCARRKKVSNNNNNNK